MLSGEEVYGKNPDLKQIFEVKDTKENKSVIKVGQKATKSKRKELF